MAVSECCDLHVHRLKPNRSHVLHDLCPYICVFEGCRTADAFYRTSELWMNHMRDEHTKEIWRCAMCGESSVFESSADFASHIEHQHAEALSADEIGVISTLR